MKKKQTTKHKKQHKKELANRKVRIVQPTKPVAEPISSARRAFQDV